MRFLIMCSLVAFMASGAYAKKYTKDDIESVHTKIEKTHVIHFKDGRHAVVKGKTKHRVAARKGGHKKAMKKLKEAATEDKDVASLGFFSSVASGIKKGVNAIGNTVEGALDLANSFLGSDGVQTAAGAVGDNMDGIMDAGKAVHGAYKAGKTK
jgi:hypothetical protein